MSKARVSIMALTLACHSPNAVRVCPGLLPALQSTKVEMVLNLKTGKAPGINATCVTWGASHACAATTYSARVRFQ